MAEMTDELSPEEDHFVRLMTTSQRELRAFILGLVPTQMDADDLLQEVNLALWRKRNLYDKNQEFLRWAFGFAVLEVRSFRSRSARNRLWFSDSTIELLAEAWPQSASFMDDCHRSLAACLKKLSDAEREVIEAKYGNGLSAKQIAHNANKPLSTVYYTLKRSLESLRICVEKTHMRANR